jgi:hypothetical protein
MEVRMRTLVLTLGIAHLLASTAAAAVLCKKPSGAVLVRDTACRKKESPVDLTTLGERDTLGGLACKSGESVQWTGSAWACAPAPSSPLPTSCAPNAPLAWNGSAWACGTNVGLSGNFLVGGTTDLLDNGTANGRIVSFITADPQSESNDSYDGAGALRLPLYTTTFVGATDITAPCRVGDQVVSGGCIVTDDCVTIRAYPIVVPPPAVSGWHCRAINRSDGTPCVVTSSLTAISVCLKSF